VLAFPGARRAAEEKEHAEGCNGGGLKTDEDTTGDIFDTWGAMLSAQGRRMRTANPAITPLLRAVQNSRC